MPANSQKIITNLWFDRQAEEAAQFYTSVFKNSRIGQVTRASKAGFETHGIPEGTAMNVEFEIEGQKFIGINGGPLFKFNPSISFLVACQTATEVDTLWKKLSAGPALMELGEYPFSPRYGWTQDKYGVSWQIMAMGDRPITQKITPTLMYTGAQAGKAEDAINFYRSVFHSGKMGEISRYGKGMEPDQEGTINHASFTLEGQEFAAMDSARGHDSTFSEAISFMVKCDAQKEIDYYWSKLTAEGGQEGPCGWLKDKYGVSWQIAPDILGKMLNDPSKAKVENVTNAFLKMKKFDLIALERAYRNTKKEEKAVAKMSPVVHFEMPYLNSERLVKFYSQVFGWQMQDAGRDYGNYVVATTAETDENRMIKKAGSINGGFFPRKDDPSRVPSLVIQVDDIQEAMKNITAAGGRVLGEPVDVPGIGKNVTFIDTEDNKLSILEPFKR